MTATKELEIWRSQVRLPMPLFQWLKDRADLHFRSVNAEFIEMIREAMKKEELKSDVH